MSKYHLLIFFVLFFSAITLHAQFQISAEVRPRAEIRDGYKQLSDTLDGPAFFVSQRSRLALGFSKEKKYQACLAIQDVRVWGDEENYSATGMTGDNPGMDLKEAWFKLFLTEKWAVKIGRQELKYADQRLLAARDWNQNGMSYNALLFTYEGIFKLHTGFSFNNEKELLYQQLYPQDKLKTLNFLFIEKQWTDNLTGSGIYVLSGIQQPDRVGQIYLKNTSGILMNYAASPLRLNGSAYYQFGQNSEGAGISAYFWNFSTELSFSDHSLCAGIDYLSGHNYNHTDSSYLEKDHLFDVLYGARHRYFGGMDYFSNIPKGTAGGGLIDLYADSKINITDNLLLQATYHYFRLQNNVLDPESELPMNKSLGNELDLKLTYKPSKELKIDLGYSGALSGRTLNTIQQVANDSPKDAHWIWIMCTFKPVFTFMQ